jgi:hypothetical protein
MALSTSLLISNSCFGNDIPDLRSIISENEATNHSSKILSPIIAVYLSSVVLELETVPHSKSLNGGSVKCMASGVSGHDRVARFL